MKGLEISRKFYEQYGKPMLEEFADLKGLLAVGLCGSGSECFGYDDEISADHDYEPGFCIFVPENLDSRREFQLERAYSRLPKEFMGLKRSPLSPVGGNRHGVLHTAEFFMDKTGTTDGKLTAGQWFSVPDSALAEAVNGEIFEDQLGEVTEIRQRISRMPEDVRLKKLAAHLLNMGQAGQYNYLRCVRRGEGAAAQLAAVEFVKSTLQTVFLLNRRYMPYYKWSFRALRDLPLLSDLYEPLEFLLTSDNGTKTAGPKAEIIEDIAAMILQELHRQEITRATCGSLETHAYSVNDFIRDNDIRNRHILFAL